MQIKVVYVTPSYYDVLPNEINNKIKYTRKYINIFLIPEIVALKRSVMGYRAFTTNLSL